MTTYRGTYANGYLRGYADGYNNVGTQPAPPYSGLIAREYARGWLQGYTDHPPVEPGVAALMTLSAFYRAAPTPGSIANDGNAMVDTSGNGAPNVLSTNGGASRHIVQTSSPPPRLDGWVDMSQHFVTESIEIASDLAAKYRCGGIIFKAHTLSPGEINLFDIGGSHGSRHDLSDGTGGNGSSLITDWPGIGLGATPPAPSGIAATTGSGATFFSGYGSETGWMHLQFHTVASGASGVRTYLSKIGSSWAGYNALPSGGSLPYVDSGAACAADGISKIFQIGYAGSHDTGVLGIACVYLGTDAAISTANLSAIHALFV